MWKKIKSFLENKIVQIVEVCIMIACVAGLIVGGISAEGIHSIVDYVGAGIIAIYSIYKIVKKVIGW